METLDKAAMFAFFISGGLITFFGLFSILGTFTGGLMSVATVMSGDEEAAFIGILIFVIYGVWMFVCLVGGISQLLAGVQLARGEPKGALHWIATFGGLAASITVYCALPGMVAFGLGLASILQDPARKAQAEA